LIEAKKLPAKYAKNAKKRNCIWIGDKYGFLSGRRILFVLIRDDSCYFVVLFVGTVFERFAFIASGTLALQSTKPDPLKIPVVS
jgi:hypothetical protein